MSKRLAYRHLFILPPPILSDMFVKLEPPIGTFHVKRPPLYVEIRVAGDGIFEIFDDKW